MKLSPDQKLAGILCPVFSIRTENDLGIGDTDGVRQMIDWCHKHGISMLQVLPINETSDDNSPYNAISSLALDPTTIAITTEHLPELTETDFKKIAPETILNDLRSGAVKYTKVKDLKRKLLRAAFDSFLTKHWNKKSERGDAFRQFLDENGDWISDYALFRVLMEDYNNWPTWDEWPLDRQNPKKAWTWILSLPAKQREEYADRILFNAYIQWVAFDQWMKVKAHATRKKVYLMGDIPFGVNRYSSDVWGNRPIFDLDWSGGCPPEKVFKVDPFTEKWGQNWGIPLYNWVVSRQRNHDWWRIRCGNIHKVFHFFRIDHVLGFYRIYSFPWQPKHNAKFLPMTEAEAAQHTGGRLPHFQPYADDTKEGAAFNQKQGEELLAMVVEAAGDTAVVAEDLGVVPAYVPESLERLKIPGYKIPHFLREKDHSFVDGKTYPRLSLATPATHDHDPIAKMWRELCERAARGDDAARYDLKCWMKYCGHAQAEPPREFNDHAHELILRGVLHSNSWLAVLMITDVFGTEDRFNVPGAVSEGNWSYRLGKTVAELDREAHLLHKTQMFSRLIKEAHRLP
ncbi:MAG: 4-alpha-glucanotransferase [Verrucomicrobiae bacterium]|nr:4-alpha-glucanotransferase [Verrucomicrobiae bacterium]